MRWPGERPSASSTGCGASPPRRRCSRAGCGCRRSPGRQPAARGVARVSPPPSRVDGRCSGDDTAIAVGPEGGWSPKELEVAGADGVARPERAARRDGGGRRGGADGEPADDRSTVGVSRSAGYESLRLTETSRSACTCTCRSAARGATTARSPRGPTGTTSSATTSTRVRRDIDRAFASEPAPRRDGVRRRRHAVARAGRPARRRARRDPARRRRRGHRRVQPRRRHRRAARRLRRRRGHAGSASACSRWCRAILGLLGRQHDPGQRRSAPSTRSAPSASRRSTST